MSFTYLPLWAVIVGALSLISLLFALQHLRTQPKIIKIASIQLWQQAVQRTSANKLWQRFRNWIAFITSVLIALLLWLATSGVKTNSSSEAIQLYYLDTSVAMSIANNMADAKSQLLHDLQINSEGKKELWLGNAVPSMLLDAESSTALLKPYLQHVAANRHLSSFAAWLGSMHQRFPQQAIEIYYYGAPYTAIATPSGATVKNAYLSPAIAYNRGITAIGQQLTMPDNQQSTRVAFSLYDSEQAYLEVTDFEITLNGDVIPSTSVNALGNNNYTTADIPLRDITQTLLLKLKRSDAFEADDQASITLPAKARIKVAIQAGLPQWIFKFVTAHPTLQLDNSAADVSLCLTKDAACPTAKSVLYFDSAENTAVYHSVSSQTEQLLKQLWVNNSWQLAQNVNTIPALKIVAAQSPSAQLPLAQLSQIIAKGNPDPLLLLSHTIYWLVNLPVMPPYIAVNEPLPSMQSSASTNNAVPAGFPLSAGPFDSDVVDSAIATIQAPLTSALVTESMASANKASVTSAWQFPWAAIFGLIALILLTVEWVMVQRRRWP